MKARGQGLVEYAFILLFVVLVVMVAVPPLGAWAGRTVMQMAGAL